MIKEYLKERKTIIEENISKDNEKYEHNQIIIVETNNKIKDLQNEVDEASEMFSVKAREDSGFNRHEVNDLKIQIAAIVSENADLEIRLNENNIELQTINKCLDEFNDVSRETNIVNEMIEVKNKLQFCKNIIKTDIPRALIEIDNLIKQL